MTSRQSKGALVMLVERKSKTNLVRKMCEGRVYAKGQAIVEMLVP